MFELFSSSYGVTRGNDLKPNARGTSTTHTHTHTRMYMLVPTQIFLCDRTLMAWNIRSVGRGV